MRIQIGVVRILGEIAMVNTGLSLRVALPVLTLTRSLRAYNRSQRACLR